MICEMKEKKMTTPVVISSLIVDTVPGQTAEVCDQIAAIEGVEVHGLHGASVIVTVEAPSVNASYAIATSLTALDNVTSVQLVYANFEDDPVIQRKLRQ